MCGIFGYVGQSVKVGDFILEGLKKLEYRGYDSWGIAVKTQNKKPKTKNLKDKYRFVVERHVGKIGGTNLSHHFHCLSSNLGIGHTRWATHGGVTTKNAHPHLDCTKTIAVVHNGIIENYEEIKKKLLHKGHKFLSETDTEVVPHLIEESLKSGKGFTTSVRDAFNVISGLNAIVVANTVSKEIIAVKTGSPLSIGVSNGNLFVSSDAPAMINHTRRVIFLNDQEMAILGDGVKILKLPKGRPVSTRFQTVDWEFEEGELGKFPHFMLKEIFEQPKIIENIALNYGGEVRKLTALVKNAFGTFMVACGSASYAALTGTYLFSRIAKKHANFSIGSEFKYLEHYLTPQSLVIAISQSGESIDVIDSVAGAKKKGVKIAAIVNVLGSTLYRQADYKILLGAGQEKAVVATKSLTAMITALLLSTYTLAKKQEMGKKLLFKAAKNVKEILREDFIKDIIKVADDLKDKEHIYIIGRGVSYAVALEVALKIKETSYLHAEGFAGGELKHGVIALIEKGTPCIVIAPNDETYGDIISNAQEVKTRGGFIIGIGPRKNKVFDRFLETADISEATMIPQIVVAQLLAYNLALKRGIENPDKPRNLAKSVTVK